MPGIGVPELVIVLVILLVIFGPKRLPGLGRSLGSSMKEFKDSITGGKDDDDEDDDDRPALSARTTPESTGVGTDAPPVRREEPAGERRA